MAGILQKEGVMIMSSSNFRFTAISDVHITQFHSGEEVFSNALKVLTEQFPPSDLYVFAGDIVYQLDSWQDSVCRNLYGSHYDFVNAQLAQYLGDTPRLIATGNHEFPQNNNDETMNREAFEIWLSKFGQPACEHRVVQGYHFIKTAVMNWRMDQVPEYETWAMEEIRKALEEDTEKPVFLITHDAMPNTVMRAGDGHRSFSEEFRNYLVTCPRVIHISGHIHTHVLDDGAIYQEGFTSVSLPCCAVGQLSIRVPNYKPVGGFSQSCIFEVEGRRILVHRIDHTLGKEVGEPWVIDLDETEQGIYRYGAQARLTAPCPEFTPEARLVVKQEDGQTVLGIPQSFLPGKLLALYYEIRVRNAEGREVICRKVHTDFYNLSHGKEMAGILEFRLGELAEGEYTVEVRPMNCYDRSGAPVCDTFQV